MALLAFALGYAGLLALCLAMDRHHQDLMGRRPTPRRRAVLRALGWALLASSTWPCIAAWGWAMGPPGWLGLLTAAGLLLVFLLPYAPRVALGLGRALPLLAAMAFLGSRAT